MYAAVAAGKEEGGYQSVVEASKKMAKVKEETFMTIPKNVEIHEKFYRFYLELHDYFGREKYEIMHGLKELRNLR